MITQQELDRIKQEEVEKICLESNKELNEDSLWKWKVINGRLKQYKTGYYR